MLVSVFAAVYNIQEAKRFRAECSKHSLKLICSQFLRRCVNDVLLLFKYLNCTKFIHTVNFRQQTTKTT
jgi:hypothetical protein